MTDAPPRIVSYRQRDPRLLWRDEARDFTPWLTENVSYLEEAIGVGEFHNILLLRPRCDICV